MEIGAIKTVANGTISPNAQKNSESESLKQTETASEVAERAERDGEKAEISRERFSDLVSNLNESAQTLKMQLRFGYSEDIKGLYLSVLDAKSGDIIRQIPSEQAIKFIARMREVAGLLLEERV
ncbi:MAG: flagellar protein FlaG [Helicobacteraceae bacterium]|jgi:flagellar protein FlaG|nr:flagellar protein FlaG [Helicobacteraceae bacterium]